MKDLLHLKNEFSEQGILISFNGPFSHSIIEEIGNAIKRYLEGEQINRKAITDVFAVYIEQTQNARNYLSHKQFHLGDRNAAIVVIGHVENTYLVCSGNTMAMEDVEALSQRIDEINALDKAGLKALYKERLRQPLAPGAQGAGLGLIDIARRACEPLEYSFKPLDENHAFFSLVVSVLGN